MRTKNERLQLRNFLRKYFLGNYTIFIHSPKMSHRGIMNMPHLNFVCSMQASTLYFLTYHIIITKGKVNLRINMKYNCVI